jgi:hypothetical protein
VTPEQRILRSRIGGLTTAARGHVNTSPARAAFEARFYDGIPADLPAPERDRRAAAARRLHFTRLALASSLVRARRRRAPDEAA